MNPLRRAVCQSVWRTSCRSTKRWPLRSYGTSTGPAPVPSVPCTELEAALEQAYRAQQPLLVRHDGQADAILPAIDRWFAGPESTGRGSTAKTLAPYMDQHFAVAFPYELVYDHGCVSRTGLHGFLTWLQDKDTGEYTIDGPTGPGYRRVLRDSVVELITHLLELEGLSKAKSDCELRLLRPYAPLLLLLDALEYSQSLAAGNKTDFMTRLYIAQASLDDLPPALRDDLPAPPPLTRQSPRKTTGAIRNAIRGDIYDSSLWLGLEPTYTPWHRDPNPNLFGQLCSRKTVRLMPPDAGERFFRAVQTELARKKATGGGGAAVHARIRGEEMLQGPERAALHEAVWGRVEEAGEDDAVTEGAPLPAGMHEAHLAPGDFLFIPVGWWHSVKSVYADGRLNGSVNWWFR